MKLVAITSVDSTDVDGQEFDRLMQSGIDQVDRWIIVLRSSPGIALPLESEMENALAANPNIEIVRTQPCGISRARNAGIARAHHLGMLTAESIVIFPDDDCAFVRNYASRVFEVFEREQNRLLITPYGPSEVSLNRKRWPQEPLDRPSAHQLLTLVSSAGIAVRGDVLAEIGMFDERLGVGTSLHAGEDLELVLRANHLGIHIAYEGNIFMLHAYKKTRPDRAAGNAALIHAYRGALPKSSYLKALVRAFRANDNRVVTPRIGLRAWRMSHGFDRTVTTFLDMKRSIGGLQLTAASPLALLPHITALTGGEKSQQTRSILAAHISALNSAKGLIFKSSFNRADYAMADGISLSYLSVLLRGRRIEKMATTDFVPELLERLKEKYGTAPNVAIIGGEAGIASQAGAKLEALKLANITYTTHGYWQDYSAVLRELNASSPTVVLVGLGMPREAIWIDELKGKIEAPIAITCGGWLRLLAGTEKRAPAVMQRLELEWLWRLLTDPKRTTLRYVTGVWTIVDAVVKGSLPRRSE